MRKAMFLFLFLVPCVVLGQEMRVVTGRLADTTGQGVKGAIVVLMEKADSVQVRWDYFASDTFRLEYEYRKEAALLLYVSAIGYTSRYVEVDREREDQGTIVLEPLSVLLDEAVIAEQQPIGHQFIMGSDIYTIPDWLGEREYDVMSLLSFIPGLVNARGGIEIAGIGAPIYKINGLDPRPGELSSMDPKDVASVTIIRMPSAAYSKGVNGIVNITTKKKWHDYIMLRVGNEFTYSNRPGNIASTTLNFSKGKYSQSLMYNHRYGRSAYEQSDMYEISMPEEDFYYDMDSYTAMRERATEHQVIYAPRYRFNDKSFVDFQYTGSYMINSRAEGKNVTHYSDSTRDLSLNRTFMDAKKMNHSMIMRYDNTFDGKKRLTFNAIYTMMSDSRDNDFREVGMAGDNMVDSTQTLYSQSYKNRALSFSLKHERKLGEYMQLEGGVSYSNLWLHNRADYQNGQPDVDNRTHDEQVTAFLNMGHSIGDLYYQLGIRGEYEYKHRSEEREADNSWYFTPVASLSYRVDDDLNFMLYYRRNVDYPTASQLNTNRIYVQKYWYKTGNPDLKPTKDHAFMFRGAFPYNLSLTCNYHFQKDKIIVCEVRDDEDYKVIVSTEENIERSHEIKATLFWYKRFKFYYTTWSITYAHYWAKSPFISSDMEANPSLSFYTMQSFTISPKVRINLYMNGETSGNYYVNYMRPTFDMSADLQFSLLQNRLHIKLEANNFVDINAGYFNTRFDHIHSVKHHDYHPMNFTIGVTYTVRNFIDLFQKNTAGDEMIRRIH